MLRNTLSIYMVKRRAMSNIYLEENEISDLLTNLKPTEIRVYTHLKFSPKYNLAPEAFKPDALANRLGMPTKTIRNALSALKTKQYAMLEFFRDNRKNLGVKVIVGKDQVELYNLGLDVEISDAKTYREVLRMFPINDHNLPLSERKNMVEAANDYIRSMVK